MNKLRFLLRGFLLSSLIVSASAGTLYVDLHSVDPVSPYADWNTAATNIQDAIDAAVPGDLILVTNGVYASGGKVKGGDLTNRVALDKAVIVQSVNGPWETVIQGEGATNGPSAVRCAWLTNGAALIGFTLQAGATRSSAVTSLGAGGGAWCASSNSVVGNCVIRSNNGYSLASGVYQGTLNNCFVYANRSPYAGARDALLNNCTVISNGGWGVSASSPGSAILTNCVVYFNNIANYSGPATFAFCCTTPLPSGTGNTDADPKLAPDGVHLSSESPCRGAGANIASGTDIFGGVWSNPPSIGCAEWQPAPVIARPSIHLIARPVGLTVSIPIIAGQEPFVSWWQKDGATLQDDGHYSGTQTTNLIVTGFTWMDAGGYQAVVSNSFGVVTGSVAQLVAHCVDATGSGPVSPYTNWFTAATNLQDAVDAASSEEFVLVTNGIYDTGGKVMGGDLSNRVAVDKVLAVVSVNGPTVTIIEGARDAATTNGPLAVRCAWLTNGAVLSGFTLWNGATRSAGDDWTLQSGGGAWCASTNAVVSNCRISNNAAVYGGGIFSGTLANSLVTGNVGFRGGGGAYQAVLDNCTVLYNYTFSPNSPLSGGGGTFSGTVRNSIVLNNYYVQSSGALSTANFGLAPFYTYSLTSPQPPGMGNISGDPQFLDLFHVSVTSPCTGSGSALYSTGTDLDGEPWAAPPSIGCDQMVPSNQTGPLSIAIQAPATNTLVNHSLGFWGLIAGRATRLEWSFADGPKVTNASYSIRHTWSVAGDYGVTFTAFNVDNPGGVSTNVLVHVLPINQPTLQTATIVSNAVRFEFAGQSGALYTVQYATNLAPPIVWKTLQIFSSTGGVHQVTDSIQSNPTRFYRVWAR